MAVQEHILPMMRRRDREEAVNYQFVEMLSSEERHFAVWHKTRAIRNVKRPRTLAEKCAPPGHFHDRLPCAGFVLRRSAGSSWRLWHRGGTYLES